MAIVALVLTAIAKPRDEKHPAPLDYRGAVLIAAGMGLAVLGLQQSTVWGWSSAVTWVCIGVGLALIGAFARFELGLEHPLMQVEIFANRAFAVDNAVLFLLMIAFVPLFFFASMYAQISLGESASETGLYLLIFFAGFAVASQWGGRILDQRGARPTVVAGCLVAAVGFYLWGRSLTHLAVGEQWYYIVISGAGVGLVLSPANTDALNRVPASRYGEATGITQTVRNFGSSLGLAVLGSILIAREQVQPRGDARRQGHCRRRNADEVADCDQQRLERPPAKVARSGGHHAQQALAKIGHAIPNDFAMATRTVFYGMAGAMAVAFVLALARMPGGRIEEIPEAGSGAGSPAGGG